MPTLRDNLASLCKSIKYAHENSILSQTLPLLTAVSKGQDSAKIRACLEAGQRIFGENRVQEAVEKWPSLKQSYPDVELRLIGPLQTNKLKEAANLFDVIETLDRAKLAVALADIMPRLHKPLRCLIQVNTGNEPQKAGIAAQEAGDFIRYCLGELRLPIDGLMCMPPAVGNPAQHFALLRELAARHGLNTLSMGMSGDYETAIRFGATHVRVGTALFGARTPL